MKRTFKFGKIDYNRTGRKINSVDVDIELTNGVFTAYGCVWNIHRTDCISAGQNLESLNDFLKNDETFKKIYRFWKLYHLNDMHPGTPKQEKALQEKFGGVNANIYKEQCEYLKSIDLYEDNGYVFGSAWLKEEIPQQDLEGIENLIKG